MGVVKKIQPKMAFFHDFLSEQPLDFIFKLKKKIQFRFQRIWNPDPRLHLEIPKFVGNETP